MVLLTQACSTGMALVDTVKAVALCTARLARSTGSHASALLELLRVCFMPPVDLMYLIRCIVCCRPCQEHRAARHPGGACEGHPAWQPAVAHPDAAGSDRCAHLLLHTSEAMSMSHAT